MDYREPLKKLKELIKERVDKTPLANAIFVETVEFTRFDGRSCGIDNQVVFTGIYCEDGDVRLFKFSDIDVAGDGKGFVKNIAWRFGKEACFFSPDAMVTLSDAELICEIKVAAESLYAVSGIFERWEYLDALYKNFKTGGTSEFLYKKMRGVLEGTGLQEVFDMCNDLECFEIYKSQGENTDMCKRIYENLINLESQYGFDIGEYSVDSLENEPVWSIIEKLKELGIDNFDEYVEEI